MTCPLCVAERRTPWLYEDGVCWVALCSTCGDPMVVLRRHTADPSPAERRYVLDVLIQTVRQSYTGPIRITSDMRTHPEHLHLHARPTAAAH